MEFSFVVQVRWDETSNTPRPERVSPWKIDPALAPPALNPLSIARPKRPRSNVVPSSPDSSVLTREGIVIDILKNSLCKNVFKSYLISFG